MTAVADAEEVLLSPGVLLLRDKPEYVMAPHLLELADEIVDACLDDDQRFLLATQPVRHGKTVVATLYTAAWYLLTFPERDVGILCYNKDLAEEYGEQVKDIIERWGPHFGITVSSRSSAKARFRLMFNGRAAGSLRAVGLNGTLTGRGFHLILGDDLMKNREEADSKKLRDRVWSRWNGTVRTRLDVHVGTAIIVNSRWHADDIVGRLKRAGADDADADQYVSLHRPALALRPATDPDTCPYAAPDEPVHRCLREARIRRYKPAWRCTGAWHTEDGRAHGEALWPWRYSVESLRHLRAAIGDREFAAQLQGTPVLVGAGTVRTDQVRFIDKVPKGLRWVWAWDRALSDTGDWTAGALLARNGKGQYLVAHIARIRTGDPDKRDAFIVQETMKNGPRTCPVIVETEGSEGAASVRMLVQAVKPHVLIYERPPSDRSKIQRAEPFFGSINRKQVFVLRQGGITPAWWGDLKAELDEVPVGVNDDMWDCCARAHGYLERFVGGRIAVPNDPARARRAG